MNIRHNIFGSIKKFFSGGSKHLENFAKNYSNDPHSRALLQLLIPYLGAPIDTELTMGYAKMMEERERVFFTELARGNSILTKEIIESNNFLHCFFATNNYVLKTNRKEKIELFAKLLKSNLEIDLLKDTDEYEEYLEILFELSYREFQILCTLRKFENMHQIEDYENECGRATHFWDDFKNELTQKLKIEKNEIDSLLIRLMRTGCYETFTGKYYDETGTRKTTKIFDKLMNLIEKNNE